MMEVAPHPHLEFNSQFSLLSSGSISFVHLQEEVFRRGILFTKVRLLLPASGFTCPGDLLDPNCFAAPGAFFDDGEQGGPSVVDDGLGVL